MSLNERPQGGDSGRALKPMAGALTGGERGRWSPRRHAEEKAPEGRGRGQSDAAPSRGEPGTPGSWERQGGPGRRASGAGRPSQHLGVRPLVPRTAGERPSVALSPQVRGRVLRRPQEAVPPPDFFARPGQGATALRGAVCFKRSTSGGKQRGRPLRLRLSDSRVSLSSEPKPTARRCETNAFVCAQASGPAGGPLGFRGWSSAEPGRGPRRGDRTLYLVPRFKQTWFFWWVKQKLIVSWLLTCTLMCRLSRRQTGWTGGAWTCSLRSHQFQAFWAWSLAK